jgi:hypothetical protein
MLANFLGVLPILTPPLCAVVKRHFLKGISRLSCFLGYSGLQSVARKLSDTLRGLLLSCGLDDLSANCSGQNENTFYEWAETPALLAQSRDWLSYKHSAAWLSLSLFPSYLLWHQEIPSPMGHSRWSSIAYQPMFLNIRGNTQYHVLFKV